jgi:hypothetical protein
MIARYLPRSLNLLTNEIARRQEGKAARRDGGAGRGVKLSLFLDGLPSFESINLEARPFA